MVLIKCDISALPIRMNFPHLSIGHVYFMPFFIVLLERIVNTLIKHRQCEPNHDVALGGIANSLVPDQSRLNVNPDLDRNILKIWW